MVRNRIKRRLRETVRQHLHDLREGPFDIIFVGRSRAHTAEWAELQEAIVDLLRRGNILRGGLDQNERGRPDAVTGE